MGLVYSFYNNRHETANFINLNSVEDRAQLSPSALKVFFNIVNKWQIKDKDAHKLLGGPNIRSFYELKKNPNKTLDVDRLTRISYLIRIYKALHILYGDTLADAWVNMPNQNRLFNGDSPLALMKSRRVLAMKNVQALLDARQCGV
jgi:hypothetical protein